jgi:hypothetical protein
MDEVQRVIAAQKFKATLKPRLDNAVEEWHKSQPPSIAPPIIDLDNLHIKAPWTNDEGASSSD